MHVNYICIIIVIYLVYRLGLLGGRACICDKVSVIKHIPERNMSDMFISGIYILLLSDYDSGGMYIVNYGLLL